MEEIYILAIIEFPASLNHLVTRGRGVSPYDSGQFVPRAILNYGRLIERLGLRPILISASLAKLYAVIVSDDSADLNEARYRGRLERLSSPRAKVKLCGVHEIQDRTERGKKSTQRRCTETPIRKYKQHNRLTEQ
ncbi:hypothetical protein WN51_01467 [Melipona quadrifasciata]|uniref:Uncharacterized protein n=1 Tax=Melipona quadrifasciata TaxID=166423 RepID=A0A0N0BET8_9HYME|nr:hypothetical protein WN51_01467 [Melipona quadrifasciata]